MLFAFLCLGIVIASANAGCEMAQLHPECKDRMTECLDCFVMKACRMKCDEDKECKGYLFSPERKRCNLWFGTDCDLVIETKYWEKVCDGVRTAAQFERKNDENNDEFGALSGRSRTCDRLDIPKDVIHDMENVNVGTTITFFCANNNGLTGSRTITCRDDYPKPTWSDTPPRCNGPPLGAGTGGVGLGSTDDEYY